MVSREELVELYLRRHLSMEEIGKIYSLTRARISQLCRLYDIKPVDAEKVKIICDWCGKEKVKFRKQWRKSSTHYCSMRCYLSDRKNQDYRPHRNGQREARQVMAKHIGRPLLKEEIVHHIDGNCQNNDPSNLLLFPNHKAHMRLHH